MRDLPRGLVRWEVCGVDDLGFIVQPGAGCLGVRLQVREAEGRGAEDFVVLYAVAERGLIGVEHEMPDRYAVPGKTIADLPASSSRPRPSLASRVCLRCTRAPAERFRLRAVAMAPSAGSCPLPEAQA